MTHRLRTFSLPLVVSLVVTFILPAIPVSAQGAAPHDWRKGAGEVADNFSRDKGLWTVDSGRDPLRAITRGRLSLRVPEPELFRWSALEQEDGFKDFYVEVDARHDAGAADGMLGIIFRYEDADNFYAFLVSADGWYALLKYVDGKGTRPIDWTESAAIATGKEADNQLAVLADGPELVIFVNSEELDRVQDPSLVEGQIALVAASNTDGGLEASFDNFGLWGKPGNTSSEPIVGRKSIKRSTPTAPQRPAGAADAAVSSESLNVRSGPGTNYPVVGTLKKGDGVKVIGRSADSKWAKLSFAGVPAAWASAQFLSFDIDFRQAAVATAPPAPAAPAPRGRPAAQPAKRNVAWLIVENHIGRYITLQVNDQNFRVEGKAGETPGRFQFELQGTGRYRVAAQLPNGGSHNWDLYVEPTPDKCINQQGCVALGQSFLQTYY